MAKGQIAPLQEVMEEETLVAEKLIHSLEHLEVQADLLDEGEVVSVAEYRNALDRREKEAFGGAE